MRDGSTRRMALGLVALILCVGIARATDSKAPSPGLLKLKAGPCKFTLLDSNGVKPVADSMLSLASIKDGKGIAKTASDRMGQCVLNVPEGRHILKINERNLAIVVASATGTIKECRILVSEDALIVGGAAEEAAKKEGKKKAAGALLTTKQVVIGGVAVIVAGGGYAVYDHNKKDDDDEKELPPPASN